MPKRIASYDTKRKKAARKKAAGRPPGAVNRDYDIVDVRESRCAKCQSPRKSQYIGTPKRLVQESVDAVVTTIWKRCYCLDCGQYRMDKFRTEEPR